MTPTVLELGVTYYVLILVRVSGFIAATPHFGGPGVPRTIKVGLIFALTNFWFVLLGGAGPANLWQISPLNHWVVFTLAVFAEAIIGLALGYTFDLFLTPFRIAGEFVGQEMGFTLAVISNPLLGRQQSVLGQIFDMIGALMFFSLDLHHIFLAAFNGLFLRRPVGSLFMAPHPEAVIRTVSLTEEWGLQLAAPVVGCLWIATVVLALMSRSAPQLNLMTVGFPLKLIVGVLATFLLIPELSTAMIAVFEKFTTLVYQLV